jgi:hypothetical protein
MRLRIFMRRNWSRFMAIACCLLVWNFAREPAVSAAEKTELAAPFHFTPHPIGSPTHLGERRLRPMAPAYEKINGWMSSVGASTALFAVDGGTVSHDICLVDPRTDTVSIEPAPTTGQRYKPFTLQPSGLWYPSFAAPMGCLPADLNGDGWQDVVVYYWGRSPVIFMRVPNVSPSAAAFKARELTSPAQVWNTNAATIGDFDGDGNLDLVFGNYFPDGARVLDTTSHQSELIMTKSLANGNPNGGSTRLYRSVSAARGQDPDVHFAEVPGALGPATNHEWTLALGVQDLKDDGRPDLYIANDFGPDHLLMNYSTPGHFDFREVKGVRHFTTPKSKVVGNDSFKGMGVAFADLGGTGTPDILVSNITEPYALQESNFAFVYTGDRSAFQRGVAPYDDHSEELGLSRSGWSWDVKAADFDNSGAPQVMQATGFVAGITNRWPQLQEAATSNDLILAHPGLWPHVAAGDDLSGHDRNTFFVRGRDGRYVNIANVIGLGTDKVSRSFAVGDVDGDGRLDFVVANQWARSTFYKNNSTVGSFLGLRLRQPTGDAQCSVSPSEVTQPAIGARVSLTRPDGSHMTQQVYPANGHNGVNAPDLLFGLGASHTETLSADIAWRDGCGQPHRATVRFSPGWHDVILEPDGTTKGMP